MITMIWCEDVNHGIGKNNHLPWSIKEEMAHFRKTTSNKTVVMGRKTFESIGKPLPNRNNIVITTDRNFIRDGIIVFNSINDFLKKYDWKNDDVYIIGGKTIYEQFLNYADHLIISILNDNYDCDTFVNLDKTNFLLLKEVLYKDFKVQYYDRKN